MSDNKVDVLGEGVYDFSTVTCVCDDELKSFADSTPALYELHKVLRCKILSKQRQSTGVSMTGEMQDLIGGVLFVGVVLLVGFKCG